MLWNDILSAECPHILGVEVNGIIVHLEQVDPCNGDRDPPELTSDPRSTSITDMTGSKAHYIDLDTVVLSPGYLSTFLA